MSQDIDLRKIMPGRSAVAQDLVLALAALVLTALAVWLALRPASAVPAAAPASEPAAALPASVAAVPPECLPGNACAVPDGSAIAGTYREVPATGRTLGDERAPVLMVIYSDFQCIACKTGALDVLPELIARHVRSGALRVQYQPVGLFGIESRRAAEAALCAADQGGFWPYHERLFQAQAGENSGVFTEEALARFAGDVRLDQAKLAACLRDQTHRQDVLALNEQARRNNISAAPSFLINDRLIGGLMPLEEFDRVIAEAQAKRP
ncbi:MAG: hypothetical protein OHK0022_05380 [Roseiflexaceae bacterium]